MDIDLLELKNEMSKNACCYHPFSKSFFDNKKIGSLLSWTHPMDREEFIKKLKLLGHNEDIGYGDIRDRIRQ